MNIIITNQDNHQHLAALTYAGLQADGTAPGFKADTRLINPLDIDQVDSISKEFRDAAVGLREATHGLLRKSDGVDEEHR